MFEEQTYDAILNRMLGRGADDIDKREGAIFYDSLAMAAIEIAQAYWELGNVENEVLLILQVENFLSEEQQNDILNHIQRQRLLYKRVLNQIQ